jgi:hypothetical protein
MERLPFNSVPPESDSMTSTTQNMLIFDSIIFLVILLEKKQSLTLPSSERILVKLT